MMTNREVTSGCLSETFSGAMGSDVNDVGGRDREVEDRPNGLYLLLGAGVLACVVVRCL